MVGDEMYKYIKRIMDIIFSLVFLIILAPVFFTIAMFIKLDSDGPIIFKQERTGYKGKTFNLYKFRSMNKDNDVYEYDIENKTTKVGYFLKKYSLDELPQLINVLRGDMSFIGPRPWIVEYYDWFTEDQKRRLNVLPGITGLAQACGRNSISIFEKIRLDLKYVDDFSFGRDLKVVYWTVKALFRHNGYDISKQGIKNEIEELKNYKLKTNEIKLDEYLNKESISESFST